MRSRRNGSTSSRKSGVTTARSTGTGASTSSKGIYGFPRPYDGRPPIMNAAGSQEGREFAARNADFLFKISIDVEKRED